MSKYTAAQAKAKAKQIFDRFGSLIHVACVGAGVQESFLAGFTGVEAGIDREGNIKPQATRFEIGVYNDLISLRDNGYCFVGGRKHNDYSGVRRSQIADADNAAIRALATSYGFSQIMGWHCINNLKCTIADLRDPDKHFGYTVRLLKLVGGAYMRNGDLTSVLHIWNTGSANGKTYHADYVDNALAVKAQYEKLLVGATWPVVEEADKSVRGPQEDSAAVAPAVIPVDEPLEEPVDLESITAGTTQDQAQPPIDDQPPASGNVEVKKERPSLFVKAGAAFTAITGFITTMGLNVQVLVDRVTGSITMRDLIVWGSGLGLIALAAWFYDRSAKRSNVLNQQKIANAADKATNTVELT